MKSSTLNGWGRGALCAAAVAVSALLSSCGGGAGQVTTFTASRVIAFGDETSVITTNGHKYSINGLAAGSTTTIDCATNPIWIQAVAALYGQSFPECPGTNAAPESRILAFNGAVVADLAGQIDAQLASGGFTSTDLVTVLVGANDVIAQFVQYPAVGEDQLLANIDTAGAELATQVNRLASYGAKVLISTIPDMGYTPYAGDRSVGSTNGNPLVLSHLSTRFNDALLSRLTNDGHKIGLIQLDEYLIASDRATQAGNGRFANSTLPACTVALPNCTTETLVADAVGAIWLWSDNLHLSNIGQTDLGSLAVTRAQNNPF